MAKLAKASPVNSDGISHPSVYLSCGQFALKVKGQSCRRVPRCSRSLRAVHRFINHCLDQVTEETFSLRSFSAHDARGCRLLPDLVLHAAFSVQNPEAAGMAWSAPHQDCASARREKQDVGRWCQPALINICPHILMPLWLNVITHICVLFSFLPVSWYPRW